MSLLSGGRCTASVSCNRITNAYRCYEICSHHDFQRWENNYEKLSAEHRCVPPSCGLSPAPPCSRLAVAPHSPHAQQSVSWCVRGTALRPLTRTSSQSTAQPCALPHQTPNRHLTQYRRHISTNQKSALPLGGARVSGLCRHFTGCRSRGSLTYYDGRRQTWSPPALFEST